MKVDVKKHIRKGKNKASIIRKHKRTTKGRLTHRVHNGRKEVFVDGFWKHDDYQNAPKEGWSYEKLLKERAKLSKDLNEGLYYGGSIGAQGFPARKFGLLTRRLRKIDRLLKKKQKENA